MKKIFSKLLILSSLFIMLTAVSVNADSGVKMTFDFDAGTKGAWLDGSVNEKFYHLTPGQVSVQGLSYSVSSGGSLSSFTVTLKRSVAGPDKNYGTKTAATNMVWTVDVDSSDYYFYLYGKSSYGGINIYGSGYVHDHGL